MESVVVIPHIRATELVAGNGGRAVRIAMQIPPSLVYFQGHFSGCPLLPGVVQLNWAVEFGRRNFSIPGEFQRVTALKFKRVIQPGDELSLLLELDSTGRQLYFEYTTAVGVCSEGTVAFADRNGSSQ